MATKTNLQLRDARDRLIDLLGLGQTYPLRDLAVRDEKLTVPFNNVAQIPIEVSQPGVTYQLYDNETLVKRTKNKDKGGRTPIEASGTGETIILETYKIQDDITFDILATKDLTGRNTYLHQTATVKVGLDVTLNAWIQNLPYLNQGVENPVSAPRITNYGSTVTVEIENSQEGVDYQLVYLVENEGGDPQEIIVSTADVRGTLHNISLTSQTVTEDIDLRIRATKTFDPSENRETQTTLLDVILPLKVRANPALTVSLASAIIDYNGAATLKIANTQASVTYQLYHYTIRDSDFIRQTPPPTTVVTVPVPNQPTVQVRQPVGGEVWTTPSGYTAWGNSQQGTGDEIQFTIPDLTADTILIVQAQKDHQATPEAIPSARQLTQGAAILVRPNPTPALQLQVTMVDGQTDGQLTVSQGDPGIFYHFRAQADGPDLGLPAYFHQRDDRDDSINKGLNQLVVETDYVITRNWTDSASSPTQTTPESPLLETGPLPAETTLYIRAIKAQTRVTTDLVQTVLLLTLPDIKLEAAEVTAGDTAKILVLVSIEGDKYQPFLDDVSVRRARNGNGEDLSFSTEPLTQDTEFEVIITRPDQTGIPLTRVVKLAVKVQ